MLLEGLPINIKVLGYLYGRPCEFKDRRNLKIGINFKNDKRKEVMRQLFVDWIYLGSLKKILIIYAVDVF